MKILVQWSQKNPKDYLLLDSLNWKNLAKKPEPVGTEIITNQKGWIMAINVQGCIFRGMDHYAIIDEPPNVRVIAWNDDLGDWTPAEFSALEYLFRPIVDNTNIDVTYYWTDEILKRMTDNNILPFADTENVTIKTWNEFTKPPELVTRHGINVTDQLNNDHKIIRKEQGWNEW